MHSDLDDEVPDMTEWLAFMAAPQGAAVVTVSSDDQELLSEINDVTQEGVEVRYPMEKAGTELLNTVSVILHNAAYLAVVIERLYTIVMKHTKGDKSKCHTKIEAREHQEEIELLVARYEGEISIAACEKGKKNRSKKKRKGAT